jgi:hypothetical protein
MGKVRTACKGLLSLFDMARPAFRAGIPVIGPAADVAHVIVAVQQFERERRRPHSVYNEVDLVSRSGQSHIE